MSEKMPPQNPQAPAESTPEQIDTQAIFSYVRTFTAELDALPLSGKAKRELRALEAADIGLEKTIQAQVRYLMGNREEGAYEGLDVGPLYILYIRALETIMQDDEVWKIIEETSGAESAELKRQLLLKSLADLQAVQIEQFQFTGPKQ